MAASALDRRHARAVELAMEVQALVQEQQDLDLRDDVARRREWTFATALRDWLRSVVTSVPGGRRGWMFLVGLFDARKTRDALEQLDDAKRAQLAAAATELAGLLDAEQAVPA